MKIILIVLTVFIVISSCKKLEDFNKNVKDPAAVSGESLFTGAQKNLFDQMVTPNVNNNIWRMFAQQWTETTYIDEANYDLVTRTIPDNHWDVMYRDVLKNLQESKKIIESTSYPADAGSEVKKNRLAIIEITAIYTWGILVESFGNIPYSEALNVEIILPKYDDGLTVYKDLITRLNAAIANINVNFDGMSADNIYGGNMAQWLKFANSLKLKMGMVLSDVDAAYAKTVVEAASANVFTSNADNASIVYLGAAPNSNPIFDNLVSSGRHDFVPANTLVDYMVNHSDSVDPRLPLYFTLVDTSTGSTPAEVYYGGIYGESNDYTAYSHVSDKIQLPTFAGTILDYSEVEFFLAEAVEKGFTITGSAETHYNNAVTASILFWGGTSAEAASYLADPKIAYSTAAGTYKQKIGEQKWVALYNRGFEAWTEWRRFDYPVLVAPAEAVSVIPLRLTYPIAEQTLNGANYNTASSAIGGDIVDTKLFWDKY